MLVSLLMTALLLGLAGLGHCVVMCGAPCTGAARACAAAPGASLGWASFYLQLGRVYAYAVLGVIAASSMSWVRQLSAHSALLRPLWGMAQGLCLALGLWLLLRGQAPTWLDSWSWPLRAALERLERTRLARWPTPLKAFVMGAAWGALPCGQLYAALSIAALAAVPWQGGLTMAVFALPAAVSFLGLSRVVRTWLEPQGANATPVRRPAAWAMRLAGLGLVLSSTWALVHMFTTQPSSWCG